MIWLLALIAALTGAALSERALRTVVVARIRRLLAGVIDTSPATPTIRLPAGRISSRLVRGRLPGATICTDRLRLGDLDVYDVRIDLVDIRFDPAMRVVAGVGVLRGHLDGDDVRRRAGAPRQLRFSGGRAGIRVGGRSVGLRPVVDGDRIRLLPTPLSMSLPTLPPGTVLTAVDPDRDALSVIAEIDLPLLLGPNPPR